MICRDCMLSTVPCPKHSNPRPLHPFDFPVMEPVDEQVLRLKSELTEMRALILGLQRQIDELKGKSHDHKPGRMLDAKEPE